MSVAVDIGAFLASLYLVTQAYESGLTVLAGGALCVALFFVASAFWDMITGQIN